MICFVEKKSQTIKIRPVTRSRCGCLSNATNFGRSVDPRDGKNRENSLAGIDAIHQAFDALSTRKTNLMLNRTKLVKRVGG
jgi:hypothetical protein